jgi:hypothetical protein
MIFPPKPTDHAEEHLTLFSCCLYHERLSETRFRGIPGWSGGLVGVGHLNAEVGEKMSLLRLFLIASLSDTH